MKKNISILIIDNFDSFTFNLYHYIQPFIKEVKVLRNTEIFLNDIKKYNGFIISPGPGLPKDVSILSEIIEKYKINKPILGICLGHQAIAEYFGCELFNMKEVWHGVQRKTEIITNDTLFKNLPKIIETGHYHSWAVADDSFPDCLNVIGREQNGTIMAISHKQYNIKGIQFHPESILTPLGKQIIENWIKTF